MSKSKDVSRSRASAKARRQSQKDVSARESNLLQSLMDSMPDTIYFKDRQSRFIKVNLAFSRRHALPADTAVGKTDFDIFGKEHSQQAFEDEQRLMATGEAIIGKEEKEDHLDGRVTWVSSTKVPLRDAAGEIVGLVGISRDITARKQAEAALNQALSLQRATLEATTDGILVVDRAGKIQIYNQRFLKLWRLSETVLDNREDSQALAAVLDQLAEPEEFLAKVHELYLRPASESFDLLRFKDGRIYERYSCPQRIGDEVVGRVWSFRDITERHQAETTLRRLEERFHKVWDHSADGMRLTNAAGTVLMVNAAYCRMVDLPREKLEGQSLDLVFAEPDRPHVLAQYQERFRLRTVKPYTEVETTLWNGKHLWVGMSSSFLETDQGEPLLLGIFHDITERKQAEEALRRSEEKFRTIFEQSPIGIEIYDADGTQLQANPAALAMFGLTDPAEVKNFNLFEGISLSNDLKARLRRGEAVAYQATFDFDRIRQLKQYHTTKTGTAEMAYSITPLSTVGRSSALGYLLLVEDITARKLAERERERLIEELQKALAEVKTLSGIIPICAGCKKIRDDKGYWSQVESYVSQHSQAQFSHGLCPDCVKKYYPELTADS